MEIDLELYRKQVRLPAPAGVRLSVIDISPDYPEHTLVFIHGYGGQASQWLYQLREFSDKNRVIAYDLRGHGKSEKPHGRYTMDELQADLLALLDALGVNQPFTCIGHSFGGAIASEFAVRHPQRIARLVLIATAGEFRLNPPSRLLLRLPLPALSLLGPFTRSWLNAPPHVLQPFYWNTLSKWRGWDIFSRLSVPTLVLRGHLDIVFEKPAFEKVVEAIPSAQEIDVGYSGHMVMLERRQAVNRAIQTFISARPGVWRGDQQQSSEARAAGLSKQRPWLSSYETSVPRTIAIPRLPLSSLLDSAVRRFPHRTAVSFEGSRMSYRQLYEQVQRFAHALFSLGIQKGQRVMLLLPNLPQMVVAFYGTLQAGAVAVFTLPTTKADELVRQVRETDTRILVTLDLWQELAVQVAAETNLEHILLTSPADCLSQVKRELYNLRSPASRQQTAQPPALRATLHGYRSLLAAQPAAPIEIEAGSADLAAVIYTGGTTAEPKGVMLSHYNLMANTLQVRHWMPAAVEGRERFLCALSFSHSYGLTTALNVPISLGAMLIVKSSFKLDEILKAIKRYHPTIFPGVPSMYVAINNTPGVRKYGIQSIKACISGSAPLPIEVQEAFERLTKGRLVEGYGLTEASPVTHANPLDGQRKFGSIGVPLPSTEARIVDLSSGNRTVPQGQIGELAVRGPQVMLGYWNNPQATRQVLKADGWLLTGDVAQMDGDGYFRIIARKVDMWYPSKPGEPAFPRDVEEVLYEIPQIKEVAVVAFAGQPIAFVIAKGEGPTSREAILAYCKRRLPPELVPRLVIFLDDFPRSFIGKVLRRELTRWLVEHQVSEMQPPNTLDTEPKL